MRALHCSKCLHSKTQFQQPKVLYEECDPDHIKQSGRQEYLTMPGGLDSTGGMPECASIPVDVFRTQARFEAVPEEKEEQSAAT